MRRFRFNATLRVLVVVACAGAARAGPSDLRRELAAILDSAPHATTRTGAVVIDLTTNSPCFSRNADLPLIPASSLKAVTMVTAITELGPGFHFRTVLATRDGNLHVIGDGDPSIGDPRLCASRGEDVTAVFQRWRDLWQTEHGDPFRGDVVIDDAVFDAVVWHPSWEQADLHKWYAAPVGGLNLHDNCVEIVIEPAGENGSDTRVHVTPPNPLTRVVNQCRAGPGGKPILHHRHDSLEYRITGRCGKRWPFPPVAVKDPGLFFGEVFWEVISGGRSHRPGQIRRERVGGADGALAAGFTRLDEVRTPLRDVLHRAGKDSQNLFAECLFKRAGYAWSVRQHRSPPQGTWESGARAVAALMAATGAPTEGFLVVDGSGLSRSNRCTARQLAHLLAWSSRRPWFPLFRESLSIAGVDGSLRKRLGDFPDRVFAKTGTMTGVCALAGYVLDDAGARFAFAVLFNGYSGPSAPYRRLHDRICRRLIAEARVSRGNATRPAGGH